MDEIFLVNKYECHQLPHHIKYVIVDWIYLIAATVLTSIHKKNQQGLIDKQNEFM